MLDNKTNNIDIQTIANEYSKKAHTRNFINYSLLTISVGNFIYYFSNGAQSGVVMATFFWFIVIILFIFYLKNIQKGAKIVRGKITSKSAIVTSGLNNGTPPPSSTYSVKMILDDNTDFEFEVFDDLYPKLQKNNFYELVVNAENTIMTTSEDIIKPNNIIEKNLKSNLVTTYLLSVMGLISFIFLLFGNK